MAEVITMKRNDNIGNTIDLCESNVASSTSHGKRKSDVCDMTETSKVNLKTSLTVSEQSFRRRRYTHLAVIFTVSTCIATTLCAAVVLFVVFEQDSTVSNQSEDELATDKANLRCTNNTILRMKAREQLVTFHYNDRKMKNQFQPVCCIRIPLSSDCSKVLPHRTSFFPNKHFKSLKAAEHVEQELADIAHPLDCDDTYAKYVVCSMLYPPCITDVLQVEPCKAVCESVADHCQESLNNTAIGSSMSCEYSPVGGANEMICQSCTYTVELKAGEVFQFTSPNYPLAFTHNTHCVWLFTSPPSTRIKFNITNVDLDDDIAELRLRFEHNPYGTSYFWRVFREDGAAVSLLNSASVIFNSTMDGSGGRFVADVTAVDKKDALSCGKHFQGINEEDICDGKNDCKWNEDEIMCRTECGYDAMLVNEKSVETISSMNYSNTPEDCIYTVTGPSRTRLKLEFLSLKGVISGCNIRIGTGNNPSNISSELTTTPQILTEIDFPSNIGWIWFAQNSESSSFVVRVSSFSENKIIQMTANDSHSIDTANNANLITSWLDHGSIVFTSPIGYHFKLTSLNVTQSLNSNILAIGLGSDPLKYHVLLLSKMSVLPRNTLDLYTDAVWLKLNGQGPYDIKTTVSTVPTIKDLRRAIRVDDVATITFASSEIADDVYSDVITTVWIVTSVRHPKVAVKFLKFSYETGNFNFVTIGHGLDPILSSSILFRGLAPEFKKVLPRDLIIEYSSFWIRHTAYTRINETQFSLELRGIASTDDSRCPTSPGVTNDDICDDEFDCPDLSDEMNCVDTNMPCGVTSLHQGIRSKRVVGGSEPLPGSWPWQCLIFDDDDGICGCTLINELWVISASHCVSRFYNSNSRSMSIMFGSTTLQNYSAHHLVVPVALIFRHPEDASIGDTDDHDFLLIKLSRSVPFTNYIRPACMTTSYNQFESKDVCYVTGFGVQDMDSLDPVTEMHEAPVNIFSNEKCSEFQGSVFRITENQICAGRRDGQIDTCYGDSGGPLVCLGADDTWYLVGLTSFGDSCALPLRPGVYTRIFPYRNFINNIINADSGF